MSQEGDPRVQITVVEEFFRAAHNFAAQDGWQSTSAWLRHLLFAWDGRKLSVPRQKQLSVRLDERHRRRLNRLAHLCGVSRSRAFVLLIEQALYPASKADQPKSSVPKQSRSGDKPSGDKPSGDKPSGDKPSRDKPIQIPGPTAYQQWARLVLAAARATPHKFGTKAFIAGVIEQLVAKFQPHDAEVLRAQVRELLPELNRRGLVPLARADLIAAMDPDLVKRSEIKHINATFHFVDIGPGGLAYAEAMPWQQMQ